MNILLSLLTPFLALSNNILNSDTVNKNINSNNIKEVSTLSTSYFGDMFEPNDNYEKAKSIASPNFYASVSYNNTVNATLDYIANSQDIDYYYIPVLNDSYLTLKIKNVTNDDCFDYCLYEYKYDEIKDNNAYHDVIPIYSNFDGTNLLELNIKVKSGTYLLYLRGKQNETNSNVLNYVIDIDVSYNKTQEDIIVDDLFNDSSVKGALWIADFLPANDKTIFGFDGKVTYYKYNKNGLLNPDYTLDELMTISKTQPIKVADFMIWDPVLRIALHKIIATLRNELVNTIISTQEIRGKFDLVYDTSSNILSIISNIPGNSPKTKAISLTSEIINYIGLPILKSIFNYIVPNLNVNLVNYTNYLSRLESHLGPELDGNPITVSDILYAYNETFKVKQVVCFPIFICLGNRNEYSIQPLFII